MAPKLKTTTKQDDVLVLSSASDVGEKTVTEDEDPEEEESDEVDKPEEAETGTEKKDETSSQRSRKKQKTGEENSPRTAGSERPSRERKQPDRFVAGVVTTAFPIPKGPGRHLKDIPNVASKLSKKKADENLLLLHNILFGKDAQGAREIKKNIGLFSGFVWDEDDEEKQRAEVKDRIGKCLREKLLDFCDVLDIPVDKVATKKKELCEKLWDFLEKPMAAGGSSTKRSGKKETGSKSKSVGKGSTTPKAGASSKKPVSPVPIKGDDDESEEDKDDDVPAKDAAATPSKKKSRKSSEKGKGKADEAVAHPTREEMQTAVAYIMENIDSDTTTIGEVQEKLETQFANAALDKRAEIKAILAQILDTM